MSIFKKGKLSKPEFISKMIGAVISLLAFGFMWTIQFPGDTLKDNGSLSFSAMHTTFNIAFLVGAGNLGSALLKYEGFASTGLKIVAAFDTDEDKVVS